MQGLRRWRAWLAARSRRPRFEAKCFEVWTAPAGGSPVFVLEACGLTRRAALDVVERHRRRRPPVPALVVDEAGRLVYPRHSLVAPDVRRQFGPRDGPVGDAPC